MKIQINKEIATEFNSNKKVYLLGKDDENIKYWLMSPSWDCNWYWGFGYVETYNRGGKINPSKCTDINSHQHINGSFLGQMEIYDNNKKGFVNFKYINNIYDAPLLNITTFTENEGWKLSELFKQFYLLNKMVNYCHKKPVVGCNYCVVHEVDNNKSVEGWYDEINNVMIPKITDEILRILTPSK